MPLLKPDPLFKGITTSPHRKTLLRAVQALPCERYLSLGCGQFSDIETLVDAGVKPEQIICSDITLFSSVLGYLADPTKQLAELGFEAKAPELVQLIAELPATTEVEQAATLLYCIKWAQLSPTKEFTRWQRIQFEQDKLPVHKAYVESLTAFQKKVGGLSYSIRDMLEHAQEFKDDAQGCMIFSPPWYAGGYTKMFASQGAYIWKAPAIAELKPESVKEWFKARLGQPCWSIVFVVEKVLENLGDDGWERLLVEQQADYTYRYLLSNRKLEGLSLRPKIVPLPKKVYPLYDDHTLTDASVVVFKPVDRPMAMYYYDLLVKGLGMPPAESYFLFTIDRQVAGVVGLHFGMWRTQRVPVFLDNFSITMPETKYRLGRLLTHLLCTKQVANQLALEVYKDLTLYTKLKFYQTTFLSPSPSIMKVRGLMKLVKREDMPNAMFKLVYRADLKPETIQEVLHVWLAKHKSAA